MTKSLGKFVSRRQKTKRPLKVLFLNTQANKGADVAVHISIAKYLDRSQIEVWAATGFYETSIDSTRAEFRVIPNLHLVELEFGRPLRSIKGWSLIAAFFYNLVALTSLVRLVWLCRSQKITILHTTNGFRDTLWGLVVARLGGCQFLIHAHTSYDPRNLNRLGNWVLHQADTVVGVSRFTADTYINKAGISAQKVFAVHNAVDPDFFRPDEPAEALKTMRHRFGVSPEASLIGCIARLSRWKDQETLIQALPTIREQVPGTKLILAGYDSDVALDGNGSYKDYLARQIKQLNLEDAVIFSGFLSYQEMPVFFGMLDVVAHAAFEEPFGLAIVEAMACARPVVVVGDGGVPEIIRNGVDGLFVERQRPELMAEAILNLLQDKAQAERLAQSGLERVLTNFTPQIQAKTMLNVYEQGAAASR